MGRAPTPSHPQHVLAEEDDEPLVLVRDREREGEARE